MSNIYKIYITPVKNINGYEPAAIDVTEYIIEGGLSNITFKSDSNDFDIGVYTYDYVDIKFANSTGYFSDIEAPTTIFKFGRDKAKVEIQYQDLNGNYIASFKGIINDEFSKQDFDKAQVSLRVMSYDSIFRKLIATVGSISPSMTISSAFKVLLNRPAVTNLINYNASYIQPLLDIQIDAVDELYNVSFKDVFDKLLVASCSVMYIDENNYIRVRSRAENSGLAGEFWNWADLFGRNNIIGLNEYNTGLQRAFNSFKISTISGLNQNAIDEFALREKSLSEIENIITDTFKRQLICDTYTTNFAIPKKELKLTVKTELAKDLKLFDMVTIDFANAAIKNSNAPVIYTMPIPMVANNMVRKREGQVINGEVGFKIIEKQIKCDILQTTLKLREIGTVAGDSDLPFLYINSQLVTITNERVLL